MNKVFTAVLLLINISLFAQSNCERNLQEAKSDYNTGNLYAIPGKLTDCLEDGFTKTEKVDAYRLLTLTYLNINQNEKARESLIKLLNIKTDYRALPNIDPPELYSLYRKIDTDPKYFIGAIIGFNYNTIQLSENNNGGAFRNTTITNYEGSFSFPQLGAQFILPLLNNFWIKGEILYQNQRYNFAHENFSYIDTNNADNSQSTEYMYTSNNNGINLNLSARSIINNYYWKPFVEYGITSRYNISHQFLDYNSSYSESTDPVFIDKIPMNEFRKKINVGLHAHVGTMIKMGENYSEIKIGASKYFLVHSSIQKNELELNTKTIGNQFELKDNYYNNLIYQMSFSFNIPFFNFK